MEFIITGLFIIFFSYILLYSLYDILFKRSTIESLTDLETAQEAQAKSHEASRQTEEQRENSPNATLDSSMKIANNKDP
jgi:amino acid permease